MFNNASFDIRAGEIFVIAGGEKWKDQELNKFRGHPTPARSDPRKHALISPQPATKLAADASAPASSGDLQA
ncbi:hypothetical protein D9M68_961190 [compost metagenome]